MLAQKLSLMLAISQLFVFQLSHARPMVTLHAPKGSVTVEVELASTDTARAQGLMFRKDLPRNAGMLFVFPNTAPRTFWMRNTFISLDMIFINDDRRVVGLVQRAEPLTETPRGGPVPSKYVLEVNGGYAAAHGVQVGTAVSFTELPEKI